MSVLATVQGGLVQLTGNPVYINCTGGIKPVGAYEYMITLRIISADLKLEGAPFEIARTPDTNGDITFDISGILDMPFDVTFQFPVVNKYIEYPLRAFNIQIQPGERYINESGLLIENWFDVSDVFQMLKGGLSPRQNAVIKADNKTYYSTYIEGRKFLTPRPQSDYIHPLQPLKLWFMSDVEITAYLEVKAYYSDGSFVISQTELPLNIDSLYELNCNPAFHGMPFEPTPGKRILYMDVWIEHFSSPFSDVRRFEVDWNYCALPYFLMFANSLGGIDDVYLSGFATESYVVENTLSYRHVQPADTVFTPTIVSPNKTSQNKWKINTGWKAISILQFYRDLMVSKQVWFLDPGLNANHFNITPVVIQNSDTELVNFQDDQWNLDIEFIEAHSSRFSFDNRLY